MAFTQVLINRRCPADTFEFLESTVGDVVGETVYGSKYPLDADVDVAVNHARLATYMALKVEVDTEDLPTEGWAITSSGLCVPPDTKDVDRLSIIGKVPDEGLTDIQRQCHFAIQAKEICNKLAEDSMWQTERIGWKNRPDERYAPSHRLGVLVARAEGAWHATYTVPEA